MGFHYILKKHEPVVCNELIGWAKWMRATDRTVAKSYFDKIGVTVSTVFLGMDHQWTPGGPPLLFETMTFGDEEEVCERCSTWEEAEAQHARISQEILDRYSLTPSLE